MRTSDKVSRILFVFTESNAFSFGALLIYLIHGANVFVDYLTVSCLSYTTLIYPITAESKIGYTNMTM